MKSHRERRLTRALSTLAAIQITRNACRSKRAVTLALIGRCLLTLVGVASLIGAGHGTAYHWDSDLKTLDVDPPVVAPTNDPRYPVGYTWVAGGIADPMHVGIPPVQVFGSSSILSVTGHNSDQVSQNAKILGIFQGSLKSSLQGYEVKCIKGLHIIQATDSIPFQTSDTRFVTYALEADSLVLERSNSGTSESDFNASVNNFKSILQSVLPALLKGSNHTATVVPAPAAPLQASSCATADAAVAQLENQLATSPDKAPSSKSTAPSPSPSPSSSLAAAPSPTPVSNPALATPSPNATGAPGVAFSITNNGQWAVLTLDSAHGVIFAVAVTDAKPLGTAAHTNFSFSRTRANREATSGDDKYDLRFDTADAGVVKSNYCVNVRLRQLGLGLVDDPFEYCPSSDRVFLDNGSAKHSFTSMDLLDPTYTPPPGTNVEARNVLIQSTYVHDPKGLSSQATQSVLDIHNLDFYFQRVGPQSIILYTVKDAAQGSADLWTGKWSVTRVTAP
jgi:hypothetical protein